MAMVWQYLVCLALVRQYLAYLALVWRYLAMVWQYLALALVWEYLVMVNIALVLRNLLCRSLTYAATVVEHFLSTVDLGSALPAVSGGDSPQRAYVRRSLRSRTSTTITKILLVVLVLNHRLLRTYARCGESPPETADRALPKSTKLRKCSTTVAAYVRILHRLHCGAQSMTGVCGAPATGLVPRDRLALRACSS